MERRDFIKKTILATGVFLGGGITVPKITKAAEEKIPVFGPDLKSIGGRKHTPYVKAPKKVKAGEWFDVYVEVGYYHPHPNTMTHWIESVALWIDKFEVVKATFRATQGAPKALFTVKIDKPGNAILEGLGYCNLHGLWVSKPIILEVV
ncbi:desulfoferrodoxin family protein [Desulfurobacterium thermolithotrophum]|uniref:desulfoferrodoxin family protein n=1 Tax=Desulfurobacterium thermolithotrophum TaxID=64160 RepID=UPI0013CFF5DF|nr:desulfoferrodoxin family protein [Desulfurobacterium thermolithotrophum]